MSLIELPSLISIIIPVYNVEAYLEETLTSVYAQTYNNWECIIVNDGSTDNSLSIAKQWAEKDHRFKVFSQENAGASTARNYGIDLAKGEYIAFLDSDDVWSPIHLETSINQLLQHKVDLVYSSPYLILNGNKTSQSSRDFSTKNGVIKQRKAIELFLNKNQIATPSVLCKKEIILKCGKFSFHKNAEDLHLWLKLLLAGATFYSIETASCYVRYHNQSTSNEDRYCTKEVVEVIHHLKDEIIENNIKYHSFFTYWARRYFLLKEEKKHYIEAIDYINSIEPSYFSVWKKISLYLPLKILKTTTLQLLKFYAK